MARLENAAGRHPRGPPLRIDEAPATDDADDADLRLTQSRQGLRSEVGVNDLHVVMQEDDPFAVSLRTGCGKNGVVNSWYSLAITGEHHDSCLLYTSRCV